MDVSGVVAGFLLILVVAGVSDASSPVGLRVLMAEGKGDDKPRSEKVASPPVLVPSAPSQNSPLPTPPKKPAQSPPVGDKPSSKSANVPPVSGSPPKSVPSPKPVPPPKLVPPSGPKIKAPQGPKGGEVPLGSGKAPQGPKGGEVPPGSGSSRNKIQEECDKLADRKCNDDENLVACLQHPSNAKSKELVLLVQNKGEDSLSVNVTVPTSINIGDVKTLNLSKHSTKKIKFSANAENGLKIVLNAGKGECILQIGPSESEIGPSVPDWNPFQQFPVYATRLTPIYGAYFLFFTMVIAGGTWACCKFRRRERRADAGIPYQQLEMGAQPQSNSAVVETSAADGWDEGWDDDWDEEEAAPVVRPSDKNVSSNGLSSRSTNKDGWDDDWDD